MQALTAATEFIFFLVIKIYFDKKFDLPRSTISQNPDQMKIIITKFPIYWIFSTPIVTLNAVANTQILVISFSFCISCKTFFKCWIDWQPFKYPFYMKYFFPLFTLNITPSLTAFQNLMEHWLTEWLTDWLAGWLAVGLAGWLTDWLAGWLADWLTD